MCHERGREFVVGEDFLRRCCARDGGLALRRRPAGGGAKPPRAALAEDRRGERQGKGARDASGGDQEDVAQASLRGSLLKRRYLIRWHRNRGVVGLPGMSLAGARVLARRCPAWRRREPGLRLLHGTWEGEPRHCRRGWREGAAERQKPEALSTDAALAGGPARSSREAPACWGGGGAKGPAHQWSVRSINRGVVPGGIEWTS